MKLKRLLEKNVIVFSSGGPTCIDMLDELLQLSSVMFSVIGGMSSMSPGPKWDSSASWPSASRAWFTLA